MRILRISFAVAGALLCAGWAKATTVFSMQQVGLDVTVTGSGTIDLTDLSLRANGAASALTIPSVATLLIGVGNYDIYQTVSGPSNFGSGGAANATSATGDRLAIIAGQFIDVPLGYVSGTALSGTATWSNTTLAQLGVTPGTYTWNWGSGAHADSLTLVITAPEPALGLPIASVLACLLLLSPRALRRTREGSSKQTA
jgi:hypothetical protein